MISDSELSLIAKLLRGLSDVKRGEASSNDSFHIVVTIITVTYGVPLRSKYRDSEILFQKQKLSRDVQNMMPKIITYRSRPKKKDNR